MRSWTFHTLVWCAIASAVAVLGLSASARAGDAGWLFQFESSFSGPSPSGPPPWSSAVFHDLSPGTVSLTLSNNSLNAAEYVSEICLNLNPAYNPADLRFDLLGASPGTTFQSIDTGVNAFRADGDGNYDIRFSFSSAQAGRFEAGDYMVFQISGIAGLNAYDFNHLSANSGGAGPFFAAEHIQGIADTTGGTTFSAWVWSAQLTPIPEPSSALILALAAGFAFFRRK